MLLANQGLRAVAFLVLACVVSFPIATGGEDVIELSNINSCLSESRLPGCVDESRDGTCLESVCQKDETCCKVAFGPQCVDLARNDTKSCSPKNSPNSCFEESLSGGCEDRRCESLVCTTEESCCNNQDRIGMWNENCVFSAQVLCQPVMEDLPSDGGDCPSGMFCNYDSMASCAVLASQYKDVFYLGNILGGVYCGNEGSGRRGITNCPRGSYCPDPETILPCPAGYYCPFKTQEPSIRCRRCPEESLELVKDLYGWIVLCVIAVLAAAYIGWGLLNQYNKRLSEHISKLEKRVLNRMSHLSNRISSGSSTHRDQEKRDLEKLRPKLEVINFRLAKIEEDQSSSSVKVERGEIHFDALQLFDVLDADGSGDLTFDELNAILGLNKVELREFVRRMNEMADSESTRASVTRPVFAKYFLQALTDISNLTISYEEAEAMFHELAGGDTSLNEIEMRKFYTSSMSEFLSDSQILLLIKKFKTLKEANVQAVAAVTAKERESFTSEIKPERHANFSNRHASLTRLKSSRRPSSLAVAKDMLTDDNQSVRRTLRRNGFKGAKVVTIGRQLFITNYPQLLMDAMLTGNEDNNNGSKETDFRGVDLCFKDLSLSIKLGKTSVDVVKKVTGRLRGKTMTALMGGSGAGKTSLLNALCGRAHYGETTGTVYLNGHETDIQKHVDCIGFVPQDDIVYPELTVRENFIYAGKFRLPKGTTNEEIEDLADETIANLGLARVANSPVGDVRKRGVSGGEKKRVNIGIELMALPSILFLDEPTSGLDSSSALLVMKSLSHLVVKDGVTVVSVIHQPRKFIFDLFDSLILLSVGGQVVYHGSTEAAEPYFGDLNYILPKGESVADWLIDISSGRLEPENTISSKKAENLNKISQELDIPTDQRSSTNRSSLSLGASEIFEVKKAAQKVQASGGVVTDGNCVGKKGVTTGKVFRAIEDAKIRRAWLCTKWAKYFNKLDDKEIYEPPEEYDLPLDTIKHAFGYQFIYQVNRALLVGWRNRFEKIIQSTIIVGSIVFISILDGVTKVSIDKNPTIPFATLVRPQPQEIPEILVDLFAYSQSGQMQYPMKVGILLCIIVGLTATGNITSKRLEFFREAGSGYNLNAYFFAISILSTIEHSIQVLAAALFATWIHHPIASPASYYVHFLLLGWLAVGWAMLFPMICPADSVTLLSGFFYTFFGLIFSGAFSPFGYEEIYQGGIKEYVAGWLSPTRYFFEAITVGEYRCMPEQTGFTIESTSLDRNSNTTMLRLMGYAGHDLNAVRYSCDGWYWSVLPVILIGLTVRYIAIGAMYACFRAQQAKKPLIYVAKRDGSVRMYMILYFIGFVALFGVTTWLFTRDQPFEENA